MSKLTKIIFFIFLNLILTFFNTVVAAEKIKIGLLVPMTGNNKDLGQSIIKAVSLAIKDIDSDLIEIIPKDTATRPNQTLKSAFELKEMGVKVVIGPIFYESLTYLDEMNWVYSNYEITDISSKIYSRNPSGPFTTSTLQQSASSKLGFGASRTMQIAQRLYQGIDVDGDTKGLITYMRTDGTNISKDAVDDFRNYITKTYGNDYLPDQPNNYSGKKAKNAQEAHEAIRPTDINNDPSMLKKYLSSDQHKLYNLIWSRALSSQMQTAKFDRKTIILTSDDGKNIFKASGSVIKFDGFLKLYKIDENNDEEKILPEVSKGPINIESFIDEQHFTQPPPRYSEASIVKKLEELGIGRPSTYASIISVITNRGYADILNKRFFPTDRGKLISAFLEKLFTKYVDYNFTAKLEDQLDDITSGKEDWIKVLEQFWNDFNKNVSQVKEKRTREVLDMLNESLGSLIFETDSNGSIDRKCKLCQTGQLSLKNSFRGGAFIGCSNYPECKFTRPLSKVKASQQSFLAEPKLIGKNDEGKEIFLNKRLKISQ